MNKELLHKYFQNKCSPEEVKEVVEWMGSTASRTELEAHFEEDWNGLKVNAGNSGRWKKLLDKVHEKIAMEELYGTLDLPASKSRRKRRPPVPFVGQRSKSKSLLIGMSVVITGILCFAGFNYWGQQGKNPSAQIVEKSIQKSTDKGQKLTIHLSDGSTVVLNSGSRLEYPEYFAENERVVKLTGEGFFQVAKDVQRPFRVVSGPLVTTALGTSFNIRSNVEKGIVEVALVTGKVVVNSPCCQKAQSKNIVLNPGEMLAYSDRNGDFHQGHFDVARTIAWKDGILVFDNASYQVIKTDLENWFGVDITDNMAPKRNWQFTAKFDNENLENILDALQFGHPFQYKIDRKEVVIKF